MRHRTIGNVLVIAVADIQCRICCILEEIYRNAHAWLSGRLTSVPDMQMLPSSSYTANRLPRTSNLPQGRQTYKRTSV